jgi:hypothetical protein
LTVVCGTECTPSKKKIYLHIGHGKTGTSSIQSVLARAEADLKSANVLYPCAPGCEDAKKGLITSGNVPIQSLNDNWFVGCVVPAIQINPSYKTYIFSSEMIFYCMDSFFSGFQNCRKYLDFEFLLCVRNPFDMLGSVYQQQVKRSGVTLDFLDFLEQQDYLERNTIQALAVVERLEKLHLKVNVFNYSVVGRSVCSRVLEVMNVHDVASAHIVANEVVNRSLDAAELALILLINSVFGAVAGGRVSDSLVNGLPDIPSVKMACSESAVAIVKSKMQPFVDEINRRLPEDERLSLEPSACHEEAPRSHSLNGDQAVVAYDELVYCFKENLVSSRLKLDGLTPVASLILLFFLATLALTRFLWTGRYTPSFLKNAEQRIVPPVSAKPLVQINCLATSITFRMVTLLPFQNIF